MSRRVPWGWFEAILLMIGVPISALLCALVMLGVGLLGSSGALAAGRVFFDGFEDGTTNQWSQIGTREKCTIVTTALDGGSAAHSGTRSARCNMNGAVDFSDNASFSIMQKSVPEASEYLYRLWSRADSDVDVQDGSKLLRLQGEGCSEINYTFEDGANPGASFYTARECNTAELSFGRDTTGGWPKTAWRKWEIYIKDHATQGVVRFWVNGVMQREAVNVNTSSASWSWGWFATLSNWSSNPGWEHDANNHIYIDDWEVFTNLGTGMTGNLSDATAQDGGGGSSAALAGAPAAAVTVTGTLSTKVALVVAVAASATPAGNLPQAAALAGAAAASTGVTGTAYIPLPKPATLERRAR